MRIALLGLLLATAFGLLGCTFGKNDDKKGSIYKDQPTRNDQDLNRNP